MKIALITYDLKNIKPDDNNNVKKALLSFTNTFVHATTANQLSIFMEQVVVKLPDTTVAAEVNPAITSPKAIVEEVIEIIKKAGATPDKVYVAFVDTGFCWNSAKLLE